jgi:2-oxoglutarate dehydrogenase complex dehydrogenase (E1) component-like enzyme
MPVGQLVFDQRTWSHQRSFLKLLRRQYFIEVVLADVLRYVGAQSVSYPPEFEIHSHLKKHHVENRLKRLESGAGIDWGTAEALAIGSLLYQV